MSLSPRWLGLGWSRLSSVQRAILVSAAAFVVWFFVATCKDAENFHGVDLRPKVLGARAMLAGLNPYNYTWKPGMSERLLDPWRRHPGPTRTTYPPPLLLFYAPLANVAYTTQRLFWFGAEWAAMLATTFVAARLSTGRRARVWFFGVAGFAFVGNWFFRLHVERGQYYVFVALLLVLALADLLEGRERLRTALVLGVTVALRPTFGLVPLLLFFAGKRRLAITTLGVAAALCLATVPLVGVSGWRGYLALVRYHQGFGGADIGRDFGPEIHVPRKAEGLELVDCLPHNGANVSFNALYGEIRAVPLFRAYAKAAYREPLSKGLAVLSVVAGAALVYWARRRSLRGAQAPPLGARRPFSLRLSLVLVLVVTLAADFFLAPERYSYGDVLLLPVVALLLPVWGRARRLGLWFATALLGLAMGTAYVGHTAIGSEPDVGFWATWLRNAGVMLAATGTVAVSLYSRARLSGELRRASSSLVETSGSAP